MLFNTLAFLFFYPAVVVCCFVLPPKRRWVWLLSASYAFYMTWQPGYVVLIIGSTLIDFVAGLVMGKYTHRSIRRCALSISIVTNLSLLFFFKYWNFVATSLNNLFLGLEVTEASSAASFGTSGLPLSNYLLPVGISFYTFQSMSYTIDVYLRRTEVERHFGIFALYVSFFPQLVAGPIERSKNLLVQLRGQFAFDYSRMTSGLQLMAWGMFKKVVIADRLAVAVDMVYSNVPAYTGPTFVIATVLFAYQIYCDFSGYTDIAIGGARVLGVDLTKNFNLPYHARSIPEFWRRWHISLSTWFRDYVYVPLGGNRAGHNRWLFNLFITMLISGLWHGANWTFLLWGALHGTYMLASIMTQSVRTHLTKTFRLDRSIWFGQLQVVLTFSLVCFSWIFFRANSIGDAWFVVTHLTTGWSDILTGEDFLSSVLGLGLNLPEMLFAIGLIIFLELTQTLHDKGVRIAYLTQWPTVLRWPIYYLLVLLVFLLGVFGTDEFIYFQF